MQNGQIPAKYKEFLDERYLVCGITSPIRNIIDGIRRSSDRHLGIYKCSTNCDFIFMYEDCGYPAAILNCQICGSQVGGHHNLVGLDRGSKRLGPCLYYDHARKRFTPERHQQQIRLYVYSHLRNHQTYWRSFPWYMRKEALQMSNKRQTRLPNNKILKLSGYRDQLTLQELNQMQRIHRYSKYMLRLISCTFMYFASKLNIISEKQIEQTFKKSKIHFQDLQYKQMIQLYEEIKKNIDDVIPWTLGITKQIFLLASNYTNQCDKLNQSRKNQLEKLISEGITQKNQKHGLQKQLIDEIISNLKTFQAELLPVWQTKTVHARQNFEIMVDSMVSKILSAQAQIDFIKKNEVDVEKKNQKYSNDSILKELAPKQYLKSQLCVIQHTSIVRPLPEAKIAHIDQKDQIMKLIDYIKCYENQIQQYPLLDEIVKGLQSRRILQDYKNIMCFVAKLTNLCDRKIQRHIAKQMSFKEFLMNMKDPQRTQLLILFNKFQKSWTNYITIQGDKGQYGCKQLGRLSPLNETYKLNYFLPDTKQDVENTPGVVIVLVLSTIASKYNRILSILENKIGKKKISSIILDPSKAEPHQIIHIDIQKIAEWIKTYTNYNVVYGKTVAIVSYGKVQELIEQKQFVSFFKFKTNMKNIRNIIFKGENMLSEKYSNCLQNLKRSPNQINFSENQQKELKEYFQQKQTQNADGFYNECRDILDQLQIIMIYQENFKCSGQVAISQFIHDSKLKNQVQKVYKHRRYPLIKMKNLVALYQIIEENIESKADLIIPEQYKVDKLTNDEKRQIESDIKTLKDIKQDGRINFTLFYKAIKRMIFRRMLSFDPTMVNQQIGISLTRLDYWPKYIQEDHLGFLMNIKIKITGFYEFFLYCRAKSPQRTVLPAVQIQAEVVNTEKIAQRRPQKNVNRVKKGKIQA